MVDIKIFAFDIEYVGSDGRTLSMKVPGIDLKSTEDACRRALPKAGLKFLSIKSV